MEKNGNVNLKWKNNRSYIITEIMKCAREVVNLTLLRDLKHIANKSSNQMA